MTTILEQLYDDESHQRIFAEGLPVLRDQSSMTAVSETLDVPYPVVQGVFSTAEEHGLIRGDSTPGPTDYEISDRAVTAAEDYRANGQLADDTSAAAGEQMRDAEHIDELADIYDRLCGDETNLTEFPTGEEPSRTVDGDNLSFR